MAKYRVRLSSGRVVGPFHAQQILEMRSKGHVLGGEDCQDYPAGDWLKLSSFDFWSDQDPTQVPVDGTFVADLSAFKPELEKKGPPSEAPDVEDEAGLALEVATPAAAAAAPDPAKFVEFDYRKHEPEVPEKAASIVLDIPATTEDTETEKTIVRTTQRAPQEEAAESEGRTIVTPAAQVWRKQQEEQRKRQELFRQKFEEESRLRREEEQKNRVDYNEDKTQVASLAELKSVVKSEAKKAEVELAEVEELQQRLRAEEAQKRQAEAAARVAAEEREQEELESKDKRKKVVLLALALLVVAAVLFPEEKKPVSAPKIVPVDPEIKYPLAFDKKDTQLAEQNVAEAKVLLSNENYLGVAGAAKRYRIAFENDVDMLAARNKMIRLYGWLLPHSSEKERDGNTIFKLIQAYRMVQDIDPDVALGAAYFYRTFDKRAASFDVMDRFVKSGANNPTRELFAAYLISLCENDKEKRADEVAASLVKTDRRGIEVNLALIKYYRYKNYPEKAQEILKVALQEHPKSVPLLIARGEFEVEALDLKALRETLRQILALGAESSRVYYSKYLEFEGILLAASNKPLEAAAKFAEALTFNDSETLRDSLTNIREIDPGANDAASKLIKQIKARELYKESQEAQLRYDFETGLLKALEAYGLRSGYVRAELGLAQIQMRLGMTKDALQTLESLKQASPNDAAISFALLEAYVQNYKLVDAKRLVSQLAMTDLKEDWRYASLSSRLYDRLGDINQSILWLQKAITLNPIEDSNLFALAKLYIRAKRFAQAKNYLFRAMELNPTYIEYKLAYAEIVYEMEGAEKAVEYLFGLLSQFPKHPAVLGEIAIYYHRAGKNQQFLDTKKEIESLSIRDPRVYRFLVRASVLDERFEEAITYTEELLKLEPGELSAMMDLGKILMQLKRYKEAAQWFVRIRDKLPTYPRVGFYKAQIELYVGNPDQALLDVREDMKMNGEYEEGINLVGDILFKKEDYIGADNEYKKALKINARSYGALRGLADIAAKRGQIDISVDLYKRAISEMRGISEPTVHRKLGDVYRMMGQGPLAIESYQLYLKLLPDAPDKAQIEQHIRLLE